MTTNEREAWGTTCMDGNVIVLLDPARNRVFGLPMRCRRLNACPECCAWEWARQERWLRDSVMGNGRRLYVASHVTTSQWDRMMERRKLMGSEANYFWVSHLDGTRFVMTDEDLTPRSGRLAPCETDEALRTLARHYMGAEAVKRWPSKPWKVTAHFMRIAIGSETQMAEALRRVGCDLESGRVPPSIKPGELAKVVNYELDRLRTEPT